MEYNGVRCPLQWPMVRPGNFMGIIPRIPQWQPTRLGDEVPYSL